MLARMPPSRWLVSPHEIALRATFALGALAMACASSSPPPGRESSGSSAGTSTSLPIQSKPAAGSSGSELRIVPQLGHAKDVDALCFAATAQTLLTSSADGTLKLWDIPTRTLLLTLESHPGTTAKVDLSDDGRLALSVYTKLAWSGEERSLQSEATLWDLEGGRAIRSFPASAALLGPDDSIISLEGAHVMLRDRVSGDVRHALGEAQRLAASPDRRRIVMTPVQQGSSRLCDTVAGTCSDVGFRFNYHPATLSVDGSSAVLMDKGGVVTVDLLKAAEPWPARVQALVYTDDERFLALSPDGRFLVTAGGWDGASLWRLAPREPAAAYQGPMAKYEGRIRSAAFSPEGKALALGYEDGAVDLIDMHAPRAARRLGQIRPIYAIASAPSGGGILTGDVDGYVSLWSLPTMARSWTSRLHPEQVNAIAVSPDGQVALSGAGNWDPGRRDETYRDVLKVWDVATGTILKTLEGPGSDVIATMFLPDGKRALSLAGFSRGVASWSVPSWAPGPPIQLSDGYSLAASQDGRHLAVGGDGPYDRSTGAVTIVDLETNDEWRIAGHRDRAFAVSFSVDGQRLLSAGEDLSLRFTDVKSNQEIWRSRGHRDFVKSAAVLRDGRRALSGSQDGTVKLWDLHDGVELRSYRGGTPMITLADESMVAAVGSEGAIRVFRLESGNAMSIVSSSSDWLVYTDDGYFDASRNGGNLVTAARGLRGFRIDQLAIRNNRPDIILERMGLGTPELIEHYRARYEHRLKKLGLRREQLSAAFAQAPAATILDVKQDGGSADIAFEVTSTGAGLLRYNVHINDVPLFGVLGKPTSGKRQRLTERVELTSGSNKIEISALDVAGIESLRPFRTLEHKGPAKSDLHFVGFGVSRYKNPAYDLSYAHKDVLDLAEVFKAMRGKAFQEVHVTTFVNEAVTAESVSQARDALKKARVDDTAVLFIAGHGLHTADAAADYYYGTYEMDPERLPETAAPFEQIEGLLQDVAPRRKLFLIDTCESGERDATPAPAANAGVKGSRGLRPRGAPSLAAVAPATTGARKPRPYLFDRDRYIYNDLTRRTGAIVLSSSRGEEPSQEDDELQNGVFTEEVMKALTSDAADSDKDGAVSTGELREYVARAVAAYTGDRQHPVVDRDNLEANFGFSLAPEARWVLTRNEPLPGGARAAPPAAAVPHACGCRVVEHREGNAFALYLALAATLAARRWSRRRTRRALAGARLRRGTGPGLARAGNTPRWL